jgi:hypothetical protein
LQSGGEDGEKECEEAAQNDKTKGVLKRICVKSTMKREVKERTELAYKVSTVRRRENGILRKWQERILRRCENGAGG